MSTRLGRTPLSFVTVVVAVGGSLAACASHTEAARVPELSAIPIAPVPQRAADDTPAKARRHLVIDEAGKQSLADELAAAPIAARNETGGATSTLDPKGPTSCARNMVLVDGDYCTEVEQTCIDWMEQPTPGGVGRCRKFAPSVCKGERVHKRFCIDKDEYTAPNETLPENFTTYLSAGETCTKEGKRLCKESEWNFACEGEEMLPYPIGYERDATKCNYDQSPLLDSWGKVRDLRRVSSEMTECVSPFGVRNMSGNVDEWTDRDVTWGEYSNAMKGGWWMAARNRCRPATTAHWDHYSDFQTGFRCCSDAH